jgi:hypothetical protein
VKLGKSVTETLEMIREKCGGDPLSQTAVSELHSGFKVG